MTQRLRCAIYTRKSTEEGLEQGFNSLHAQREACAAYILSQAGEGWQAVGTIYDDGGFSGGSMDRPALAHLLADIGRGQIDVVVVYKVDRLTRSLADFAKIVEIFDARGVSFVSVTQAFNTTTSMGRLTLNVLLSFAQFEREVTGERIRDKIAASKTKGLRMGGRPPLGYDVVNLRPVINAVEADRVRNIFRRFLELGSVAALETELARDRIGSKRWVNRQGSEVGGRPFTRGALKYLLTNPVYRGANRHKSVVHEATHEAVIEAATWDAVQAQLSAGSATMPHAPRVGEGALLEGLLFDDRGHPMPAVHTTRGAKRYRYYLSRPRRARSSEPLGSLPRIAAGVLDAFVLDAVEGRLALGWRPDEDLRQRVAAALTRVALGLDEVTISLRPAAVKAVTESTDVGDVEVRLPIALKRREGAILIAPTGAGSAAPRRIDKTLVRAVVLARSWASAMTAGEFDSIKALAQRHGLCPTHTMRLAPLGYLAPDLVAMALEGRHPPTLSLKTITAAPLPLDWRAQRQMVEAICAGCA
ncbi:MAG TPA: recombinase family protein [Caulobacteraceae bacterium]|nr:recombinase family protein [Caulobacteraceae bacterium]